MARARAYQNVVMLWSSSLKSHHHHHHHHHSIYIFSQSFCYRLKVIFSFLVEKLIRMFQSCFLLKRARASKNRNRSVESAFNVVTRFQQREKREEKIEPNSKSTQLWSFFIVFNGLKPIRISRREREREENRIKHHIYWMNHLI